MSLLHKTFFCLLGPSHLMGERGTCRTCGITPTLSVHVYLEVMSRQELNIEQTIIFIILFVYTVDDELSALSEHSSDEQGLPPQIPTHSSVIMVEGGGQVDEDDDSLILTPSEAENGKPNHFNNSILT